MIITLCPSCALPDSTSRAVKTFGRSIPLTSGRKGMVPVATITSSAFSASSILALASVLEADLDVQLGQLALEPENNLLERAPVRGLHHQIDLATHPRVAFDQHHVVPPHRGNARRLHPSG